LSTRSATRRAAQQPHHRQSDDQQVWDAVPYVGEATTSQPPPDRVSTANSMQITRLAFDARFSRR
jgi:hypothetical protein